MYTQEVQNTENKEEKEISVKKFNWLLRLLPERTNRGKKAFTFLYNYLFPIICGHIVKQYHNTDLALDVLHTFFERFCERKCTQWVLKPNEWTCFVCDNILRDYYRDDARYRKAYEKVSEKDKSANTFDLILYRDAVEKVRDLGEPTHSIIMMNTYDGYSLKEISQKLDMNYATVRQQFSRGIQKLRKFYNHV